MKRKKRLIVLGGLAAIVAVATLSIWALLRPAEVEVVEVERREVVEVYVATGRVSSRTVSSVGSELSGRVGEVRVVEGDRPAAGEELVVLVPTDAELAVRQAEARLATSRGEVARARRGSTEAQVEQARAERLAAEAQLRQARRELARAEALTRGGVGTPSELDRARLSVEQAEARLAATDARVEELEEKPPAEDVRVAKARAREAETGLEQSRATLEKTVVTAPFDGLVLGVEAARGENVAPGQELLTLARVDDLEVFVEVDEDYFARLSEGQNATLVFPSMPDERFAAVVRQVGPEVDASRGVVGVHLRPEALPANVVPDLTVDVAIELQRLNDARAVPRTALIREGAQTFGYAIRDGHATRVHVSIRAEGEDYFAVAELGDVALIRNATAVEDGDRVRPRGGR